METHENQSPASSITKLGYVRFAIPERQGAPGVGARPGGIIELPSFTNEESARPTVQMPSLTDEPGEPLPAGEAFDRGGEGEPAAAEAQPRPRTSTLLGVVPFPVRPAGSSPEIGIVAAEAAAAGAEPAWQEPSTEAPLVAASSAVVVSESLWAAVPTVAAPVALVAPVAPVAPLAVAVAVAPAAHPPVLDDADEDFEPLPRAAFAWWHLAFVGGALATLASAIGVAALT